MAIAQVLCHLGFVAPRNDSPALHFAEVSYPMPGHAKEDVCQPHYIDKKRVRYVERRMQPDGVISNLAATFQILGDPTRVKIIFALLQKELCVCDLAGLLGLTSSAISHQLRTLRDMRLVKYRKKGRIAYYSLDDEHISRLFKEGLRHVEEFLKS